VAEGAGGLSCAWRLDRFDEALDPIQDALRRIVIKALFSGQLAGAARQVSFVFQADGLRRPATNAQITRIITAPTTAPIRPAPSSARYQPTIGLCMWPKTLPRFRELW
jgi:hypothetical protein